LVKNIPTKRGINMDEFKMTVFMVLGILLRIGIPLGLTFLLARFLRHLDAKWREEASEVQPGEAIMLELWLNHPCWDELDCTKEQCENCAAYHQKEKPCWEVFRVNGNLRSECQECEYRNELLLPVRINIETSRR
jgi:hypothetical protein